MSSRCAKGGRSALSFAGNTVTIDHADPESARIVPYLFPQAVAADPDSGGTANFRVRCLDGKGRLALYRGDQLIYLGESPGHLAELLMGETCRHLVEHSMGGVVYHAGLVTRDGVSLLLPGVSGAGKSTLTAWLCSQGWTYRTDELVYVPEGSNELIPLVRALSLNADSRAHLPTLRWDRLSDHIWPSASGLLIAAQALNASRDWGPLALSHVLFARYSAAEPPSVERLSTAQTAFLLLESLVNGQNLIDGGLKLTSSIARRMVGDRAVYSHLTQLESLLALMATSSTKSVRDSITLL